MNWNKPELVEVNMSAEIGAYQDDSGERDDYPVVITDESSVSETA